MLTTIVIRIFNYFCFATEWEEMKKKDPKHTHQEANQPTKTNNTQKQ